MRVYKETPNLRKSFIRGKEAEDDDWNAICVTGHQWSALTRQFAKSTSMKEKAMFGILSNALPGILQQRYKEEMEKFRKVRWVWGGGVLANWLMPHQGALLSGVLLNHLVDGRSAS